MRGAARPNEAGKVPFPPHPNPSPARGEGLIQLFVAQAVALRDIPGSGPHSAARRSHSSNGAARPQSASGSGDSR
jgi:hypothetical protein